MNAGRMPCRCVSFLCFVTTIMYQLIISWAGQGKRISPEPTEAASWGPPGKTGKTKLKRVHESWLAVQSGFDAVKKNGARRSFFCASFFFLEKKRIIGYSIRYDAFYRQRHTTIRKAGADAYEMSCAGGRQRRPAVAAVQEKLSQAVYQYPEGSFYFSGNDCQEYSLL